MPGRPRCFEGGFAERGAAGGKRRADLGLHQIGLGIVEALAGMAEQVCGVDVVAQRGRDNRELAQQGLKNDRILGDQDVLIVLP